MANEIASALSQNSITYLDAPWWCHVVPGRYAEFAIPPLPAEINVLGGRLSSDLGRSDFM
jgi:hypothetical protein